jgi:deazaflavin-dependent oxidoreductase (nitroreductase family)
VVTHVPRWVRLFNPLAKLLLALGVPMGPDVLLTVPGRKTGLPRSTPVAVAQIAGRWWLIGPFGEVDWVRNLRASGRGTLTDRRVRTEISARELGTEEKVRFFREVLDPYLRANRLARWFVRTLDRIPEDPLEAAKGEIVFEVHRGGVASGTRR